MFDWRWRYLSSPLTTGNKVTYIKPTNGLEKQIDLERKQQNWDNSSII